MSTQPDPVPASAREGNARPSGARDRRLEATTGPLANRSKRAVFLAYHSVHPDGPRYLSVTPDHFESHLEVLRSQGYASGTHADLVALGRGERLRRRLVFLTFDDGYMDSYTEAWPLLRGYGFTGTIFLPERYVGGRALDWRGVEGEAESFPRVMRSMSWAEVEEMAECGMEFGSHTATHAHLPALPDEELHQELRESRRAIGDRLGRCDLLAYPYGEWDLRVALAAAAVGYAFAFTLPPARRGTTTALSIPRLSIDHRDGVDRFRRKLTPVFRAAAFTEAVHSLRLLKERARGAR
jgi:peptidoglycan/xylan/chitin deacetylase (PgdA/CDA1 family)